MQTECWVTAPTPHATKQLALTASLPVKVATVHIHQCHFILLPIPKADNSF